MKKKLLSILLSLAMVITMMPAMTMTAFATGTTYAITNGTPESAKETNHGYIAIDKATAAEGETVTVTVNPATGYQLKSLTVAPTGFVDLGIKDAEGKPLYWKETNLGASNPQDPGDYYMWGTTALMYSAVDRSKTSGAFTIVTENPYGDNYKNTWDASLGFHYNNLPFTDGVYKNNDGERNVFTKYTTIAEYAKSGTPDNITTLQPEDDAATAENENWRMPTKDEFVALAANCVLIWTSDYNSTGNAGYIVYKAKNDTDKGKVKNKEGTWTMWDAANSKCIANTGSEPTGYSTSDIHIFLPAAGRGSGNGFAILNAGAGYWSSTLCSKNDTAYGLAAYNAGISLSEIQRQYGYSIRPVMSFSGITPAEQTNGTYHFTMPGYAVTVTAEFEDKNVAKIGDITYETLANALAAAQDSDTITLLKDMTIIEQLVIDKAITFDGNGKTITRTPNTGQASTRAGILVTAGATIKNLTVSGPNTSASGWDEGEFGIKFFNANDATLDGVTVTGANAGIQVNGGSVTMKNKINVSGNEFGGIELCHGGALNLSEATLKNDGETDAKPVLWNDDTKGTITFNTSQPLSKKIADANKDHYYLSGTAQAEVSLGGQNYLTLADALADAKANDTITLQKDITITEQLNIDKAITLDGNSKTITRTPGGATAADKAGILVTAGATIKNLIVSGPNTSASGWNEGEFGIKLYKATGATLNNVTVTGANAGIQVNDGSVTMTGTITVSGNEFGGIELCHGGALNLSEATLVNDGETDANPVLWNDDNKGTITFNPSQPLSKKKVDADKDHYYLSKTTEPEVNLNGQNYLISGGEEKVEVSATVSGEKATVGDISEKDIEKVVSGDKGDAVVEIDLSGLDKTISEVELPVKTVEKIAEATQASGKEEAGMRVKMSAASVTFDTKATQAMVDQAEGNTIQLVVDDIKTVSLNAVQKEAVEKLDTAIIIDAYLVSNGIKLCTESKNGFAGGKATVALQYEIKNNRTPLNYKVFYVDDNGKLTNLKAKYNEETKSFVFDIEHFSNYAVAYDENGELQASKVNLTKTTTYKNGKIKLIFKRLKLSDGKKITSYQIYRSTSKKFNKNLKKYSIKRTANTKSYTWTNSKKLKKGTKYYYKVRGRVKLSDGTYAYTKWSNVKTAKCKKSR